MLLTQQELKVFLGDKQLQQQLDHFNNTLLCYNNTRIV